MLVAALSLVMVSLAVAPRATLPASRSNVLVILSDDQRHDTMEFMARAALP